MKVRDSSAMTPIIEPKLDGSPKGAKGSSLFHEALDSVRDAMHEADGKAADAMTGTGSVHSAMIAMTKADLGFRFLTQVRGKAIEAYRQLMNLQF